MVKASSAFATTIIIMIMFLVSTSFTIRNVEAINGTNYVIENVSHKVELLYNGYIFINDTIKIVGSGSIGEELDHFLIGFPYKYNQPLLRCVAYDKSNIFDVKLNVPLEDQMGFFAVEIDFPEPLDTSSGTINVFTVGFILSNNFFKQSAQNTSRFIMDFPAYPGLTKVAGSCNVTIVVPEKTEYVSGTVNTLTYGKENLPAFTYSPANVTLFIPADKARLFEIKELKREIEISETGEIEGSDSYHIVSKSITGVSFVEITLPFNVSIISVVNDIGTKMSPLVILNATTGRYKVSFPTPFEGGKSTKFTIIYRLPNHVTTNFDIKSLVFPNVDCYIEQTYMTFVLPEGAKISSLENTLVVDGYGVSRNIFQEAVTIHAYNVSILENVLSADGILQINYEYNPLWLSFRPTLWVFTLAIIGCAFTIIWRKPKTPIRVALPAAAAKLRPESLKSFVEAYEEKTKIASEMELLENRVQKGKIPRRRYKVQRKTLEIRLSALSRNLAELKERLRFAGGLYVGLLRQLEVAETEISEVEANIKSIEVHHSRGELSLEAYRKLLADYQRRKEKAATTISGILLRLREEIS